MPSKTSILFLCNSPEVMAGVEKTLLILLENMNLQNFNPRVILNDHGPLEEELKKKNIDIEIIETSSKFSLGFYRKLRNSLKKRPADIVQLHLSRFYAPLLHSCGAKVVERLNMTRHKSSFYLMQNRIIDCWTSKWIDKFIVVSESLKKDFIERGYPQNKLQRVYNGIDIPEKINKNLLRKELNIPENTIIIGAVGRLTEQKGMDTVVKTFAKLAENSNDKSLHFVIAGDGELRQKLEQQSQKAGIADKTHFLGFRSDIHEVMASFDLMFYPSRWEPFANTILEAMALGTPIVTSNVGGNAEAITDKETGILVPPDNPDISAKAIFDLVSNSKKMVEYSDNARKDVEQYSVKNMVKGHEKVYKELAAHK